MKIVDEEYIEGFNIGYWLASGDSQDHRIVLNHLIKKHSPERPYTKGLRAGRKLMEEEKILKQIHALSKAKDSDIEHEIG